MGIAFPGGGTGGTGTSSQALTIVSKSANYTAAVGELVLMSTAGGNRTVTLPSNPAVGALAGAKKSSSDSNTLTIAPAGSGTIDGDPTATAPGKNGGATFEHMGSDVWQVIGVTTTTGAAGANGNTVLSTSGAPSNGTGVNGDYAYDAAAKIMYGPKAGGTWPSGVSLAGTNGTNGTNGSNGAISQLQDEGSNLTVRPTINFVGAGVTATDDAANTRTLVTIASTAGSALTLGGWRSGGKYGPANGTAGSTTYTDQKMYAVPLHVPASVTVTAIYVHQNGTAGSTGSVGRTGIYTDNGGRPDALVVDAGTQTLTANGLKTFTISQALTAGLYWLVFVPQGAPSTNPQIVSDSAPGALDGGLLVGYAVDGTLFNQGTMYSQASVSGALPANFTSSPTVETAARVRVAVGV